MLSSETIKLLSEGDVAVVLSFVIAMLIAVLVAGSKGVWVFGAVHKNEIERRKAAEARGKSWEEQAKRDQAILHQLVNRIQRPEG